MTKEAAVRALRAVVEVIIETVRASKDHGAPGGVMYAALMQYGCTLEQFERIMSTLVEAKKLAKRGQLYFVVCGRCGIAKTGGHMCGSCGEDV